MNLIKLITSIIIILTFNLPVFASENNFILKKYDNLKNSNLKDEYFGEIRRGLRHGIGKYTYANGDTSVGQWYEGDLISGIYTFTNPADYYCGEWKNDEATGYGQYYYVNENHIYSGEHRDMFMHGDGIYYYEDGSYDLGEWKKSKLNGLGVIYNKDGSIYEQGKYRNDKNIDKRKIDQKTIDRIKRSEKKAKKKCKEAKQIVKEYLNKVYNVNSDSNKIEKNDSNNIDITKNKVGGIGIEIEFKNNRYFISDVFRGYPGFYAGLKKGDQIYRIDDLIVAKKYNLNAIIKMIGGKVNTEVELLIIRGTKRIEFTITRKDISGIKNDKKNNNENKNFLFNSEQELSDYIYSYYMEEYKKTEDNLVGNTINTNINKYHKASNPKAMFMCFNWDKISNFINFPEKNIKLDIQFGWWSGDTDYQNRVEAKKLCKDSEIEFNCQCSAMDINDNNMIKIPPKIEKQFVNYDKNSSKENNNDDILSKEILYNEGIFKETIGDQNAWLNWNVQEMNIQTKELKFEIEKIKIVNKNFEQNNSLDDLENKISFFTQKHEVQIKKINDEEINILNANLGNFQKKLLIKSFDNLYILISNNSKLLNKYKSEYNKYLKSKSELEDNLDNKTLIANDIEGIFYTKNNVNLRKEPNLQSTVLSTIPKGGVVEVLRLASGYADWAQVKYKNILGYVYFPLLSNEKVEIEEIITEDNLPSINNELQIALDYLLNKEYEKAKESLENLISNNPSDKLTGTAYYWLGELLILEKNYREAALIFSEGFQKFPESIKAGDTLFKLAVSLKELEKVEDACNILDKFLSDFPKHKLISIVNTRLDDWKCPLTTNVIKNKLSNIEEGEGDNNVLNSIYYNDLIKIKELIDLELISQEEYENRKIQIVDQIINLDLSNRAGFLIKILNENLITQEDFQYIFKNLSSSINIEEDNDLNTEETNLNLVEMLNDLRDQNSDDYEIKQEDLIKNEATKTEYKDLSIDEIKLLTQQLSNCWNAPAGAVINLGDKVTISSRVKKDMRVIPASIRLVDTNISKSNPFYGPITDSALRTLLNPECTPLKLPEDKYELWKNLTITFDYSIMKGY